MKPLEIWGGVECTVNRVQDRYCDQLRETGHQDRESDLDLLPALGLAAIRYPVLWERVDRDDGTYDWSWPDRRLNKLRKLGIRPIVGLVHHGSGPKQTSLVDPAFAGGVAAFARAAALRYSWVEEWTPINEPLTTARFSALYGLWYPHLRDERMFWLALLNQADAVRLSMRAIRDAVPHARLIQTEDLGRTYATAPLADQAGFDNTRRWMTWDLLFGRVVPGHPLWDRLCAFGLEDRLRPLADDPSPPDVIGINHYLTSDRFLDHRVASYDPRRIGTNGKQAFADVEAVRALDPAPQGLAGAVEEAWQRYRTPIALTEVHNGCSREEQVRWLRDAWTAVEKARGRGVEVTAITSWALFGSSAWDTLLTAPGGYEAGAFDVRSPAPRVTAIARVLPTLSASPALPSGLEGEGWWKRSIRFAAAPVRRPAALREQVLAPSEHLSAPLMIVGATGTLGRAFASACAHRGIACVVTSRAELDLHDPQSIDRALDREAPWAVVNCAGWVRVDDAETSAAQCFAANSEGALALSHACVRRKLPTVTFSSDLVFGGDKAMPYLEEDPVGPLSVYGQSKARMEQGLSEIAGRHLIVRTAAFFSPFDEANFAVHVARDLAQGRPIAAAADYAVTPTYVPDLCNAVLDLLLDGESGIWHLSNDEELSWAAFALRIAEALGLDKSLVTFVPGETMSWTAKRPRRSGLASSRGKLMPPLQSAIDRFAAGYPRIGFN